VLIIAVVTYVYPWQEIVSGHVRTEVAFERTFGSHQIAQLILFGAFLSLLKIFNGNFVAATRMLYAIGRATWCIARWARSTPPMARQSSRSH
jgi:hypothetical protein